jgi:hypothetical protein
MIAYMCLYLVAILCIFLTGKPKRYTPPATESA